MFLEERGEDLLFSVVVPVYNVQPFLAQCVSSILSQTCKDFELILVDDGSTDGCAQMCDHYALLDSRVRVIHKENGGLVSARKTGVDIAQGEYTGYVDGDDWVEVCWLDTLKQIAVSQNPDVILFNAYKTVDGTDKELDTTIFYGDYTYKDLTEYVWPNMLCNMTKKSYAFGILPAVWAKMCKTTLLKDALCRDGRITFGEDAACTYLLLSSAQHVIGIRDRLYHYRQNRGSMTKVYDDKRFERLCYLFDYMKKTVLVKNPQLSSQFARYQFFCIVYAIINEAKSKQSLREKVQRCRFGMEMKPISDAMLHIEENNLSYLSFLLYLFIKKKMFSVLLIIAHIFVNLKYRFKE